MKERKSGWNYLLCARGCAWCWYKLYWPMLRQLYEGAFVRLILWWENGCSERLSDLFRVTQLLHNRIRIPVHICWSGEQPELFLPCFRPWQRIKWMYSALMEITFSLPSFKLLICFSRASEKGSSQKPCFLEKEGICGPNLGCTKLSQGQRPKRKWGFIYLRSCLAAVSFSKHIFWKLVLAGGPGECDGVQISSLGPWIHKRPSWRPFCIWLIWCQRSMRSPEKARRDLPPAEVWISPS